MGLGPKGHPTFVEERGLGQSQTGPRARRRRARVRVKPIDFIF